MSRRILPPLALCLLLAGCGKGGPSTPEKAVPEGGPAASAGKNAPEPAKGSPYLAFRQLGAHPRDTPSVELEPAKLQVGQIVRMGKKADDPFRLTVVEVIDEGSMRLCLDSQPEPTFVVARSTNGVAAKQQVQFDGLWKVVGTWRKAGATYFLLYTVPLQ